MKRIIFSLLTLLISISSHAFDFEVDGIYYNYDSSDMSATVTHNDKAYTYSGDIIIPRTVTFNNKNFIVKAIGNKAFFQDSIKNITMPNSILRIGENAFANCNQLSTVIIPNGVTEIDGHAFDGCVNLAKVTLSNNLDTIGDYTFFNCKKLENIVIPYNVKHIGSGAFKNCTKLDSIFILSKKCKIYDNAFFGCDNLIHVEAAGDLAIGKQAFMYCSKLKSFNSKIDGYFIFTENTSIDERSFTSGYIIGTEKYSKSPFYQNGNIKKIILPIETASMSYCLYNCYGITNATIPNGTTSIGAEAFGNCENLKSIIIPGTVKKIKGGAFENCESLSTVKFEESEEIGSVIDELDSYKTFKGCNITNLYLGRDVYPIEDLYLTELDTLTVGSKYNGKDKMYSAKIANVVSYIEDLSQCKLTFSNYTYANASLYIPKGTKSLYEQDECWGRFFKIVEGTPATISHDTTILEECGAPSITYSEGKLHFSCATAGARYYSNISCPDTQTNISDGTITLQSLYNITVFATADGYLNSKTTTATLYWLKEQATLEDPTDINNVKMRGIIVSSNDGTITLSGLKENEQVKFYTLEGIIIGQTRAINGIASYATSANQTIIAKFGNSNIKILVK